MVIHTKLNEPSYLIPFKKKKKKEVYLEVWKQVKVVAAGVANHYIRKDNEMAKKF